MSRRSVRQHNGGEHDESEETNHGHDGEDPERREALLRILVGWATDVIEALPVRPVACRETAVPRAVGTRQPPARLRMLPSPLARRRPHACDTIDETRSPKGQDFTFPPEQIGQSRAVSCPRARHHHVVKIRGDGAPVSDLLVFLSRAEAEELRDGLDKFLVHFDESGWHAHVSSSDYQPEITVAPEVV
jgi:hypothetical protein